MSALSLTIIRVGFLAVLWLFVIAAIGVVRTDLLGGPASSTRRGRGRQAQAARPPKSARPQRAGRGTDCDLRLVDPGVSRHHAELRVENDQVVLVDLGSTNGTFVNGQPVRRVVLTDGTRISLGRTTLVFRQDGPGPEDGQGSAYARTSY